MFNILSIIGKITRVFLRMVQTTDFDIKIC